MAKAERAYGLNRIAELKHRRIPQLEKRARQGREGRQRQDHAGQGGGFRRGNRRRSSPTGTHIPVTRLMEGERRKLLKLEDELHKRVIGQDEGVRLVSEAILRARAPGIMTRAGPSAVSLLLGPTGVGKTELAKTLAGATVRYGGQSHPARHVRIHGKALRLAHDRCAPRLRRKL